MTTHGIRWLLAVLLLAPTPLLAQETVHARTWACEFPSYIYADWEDAFPTLGIGNDTMRFHVDNVNVLEGTARFIGNFGSSNLLVLSADSVISFIEITGVGSLNILTIFTPAVLLTPDVVMGFTPAANGKYFKAVYSKHVRMTHVPIPSQAWGHCVAWY